MQMIFGTIETDKAGKAATFCDVDPESAKLEIRLISKGGTQCYQHMDDEALVYFRRCYYRRLISLLKLLVRLLRDPMSTSITCTPSRR